MIDDKHLALIHGEIDGVNSPRNSDQLKAYLDAHPEARQFYEELRSMSAQLQEVKAVEPPAHLQHAIMNALPPRRSPAQSRFVLEVKNWLADRFEIKYAFAFAGVMAAGVLLIMLLWPGGLMENEIGRAKLYGTIGAPPTGEKRLLIQQPEAAGTISLKQAGETVTAEIALASAQSLDLVISFDERKLGFKNFERRGQTAPAEIILREGMIKLTHAGAQNYALLFEKRAAAPELSFQLHCLGQLVYENKTGF